MKGNGSGVLIDAQQGQAKFAPRATVTDQSQTRGNLLISLTLRLQIEIGIPVSAPTAQRRDKAESKYGFTAGCTNYIKQPLRRRRSAARVH